MQLISTDTDGEYILDYLGPALAEIMKRRRRRYWFNQLYDFVVAEHQQLLSNGDAKLSGRYGHLRR